MNKIKSFFKKYKIEILSFIIPLIIFGIACLFSKVWPFGKYYLNAYDGSAQYPGFTTYLSNVLKGKESLLYSFKGGLGYNFYATAIYYLFNPTNLLSIFFDKSNIMIFYTLIIFLRIGLCGFTMSKFLKYKGSKGLWAVIFSICYALMAYNTVYFYNFMYFDSIVLLPLVILGLDKLINKKKCGTYILFLSLSILSNYYIGYMICIFSLLYFIYSFILLKKKDRIKEIIIKFVVSSLLSGLICSVILIPEVYELLNGKAVVFDQKYTVLNEGESSNYTVYNEFNYDFFTSFYKLSISSYSTGDQVDGEPNIYVSLFVIVLVILFFFNKKVSTKEKIVTGVFILFFLLCFSYNLLDYGWQFFQKPIWYPNRYSFVFSFFLITIGYKSFKNLDSLTVKPIWMFYIALGLILIIIGAAFYLEIFDDKIRFVFLLLSVICIVEYFLIINNPKLVFFIISIFFIEITATTICNLKEIGVSKEVSIYKDSFDKYDEAIKYIENIDSSENNFYRVEANNWSNLNNGAMFGYNGMYYFNSLRNSKVMDFLEDYAGYKVVDKCSTRFNIYNPIYNSLLGFKYMIYSQKDINYTKLTSFDNGYNIYLNEDALPLGFMVNNKIYDIYLGVNESVNNSDKIINFSLDTNDKIISTINYNGIKGYWEEINDDIKYVYYNSVSGGYVSYNYVADKDYYLIVNDKLRDKGSIILNVNDNEILSFNTIYPSAYKLNKSDVYEIKAYFSDVRMNENDLKIYLVDYDKYEHWISEMKRNSLDIITYDKDDYIKGKINVTEDKTTLLTTIPYDKGWNVYVDGKNHNYNIALETFISIDLSVGEHIVEFRYIPRGLIIGSIISICSIIGSVIFVKNYKRK